MENNTKLLKDFEKIGKQEVIEKITKELRGKPFEILQIPTYEGITINPFYNENDLPTKLPDLKFPQKKLNSWYNQSLINTQNINALEAEIKEAIKGGTEALKFDLSSIELNQKATNILEKLNFDGEIAVVCKTEEEVKLWKNNKKITSIDFDFLSNWTQTGKIPENAWEILTNLINTSQERQRSLCIKGSIFENAGGNAVQELAFTLAMVVEYINELSAKGISQEKLFDKIQISLAVGGNYFMQIAKFRAMRLLWEQVAKAYQQKPEIWIEAETSLWNKSPKDVYNNMLRATTEAMAAVIGGADLLTVNSYNQNFEDLDDFSRRIARNVSIILKEESHLDKVKDIAKGSYFVEKITEELAQKSWELFQKVEEKGGFVKSFESTWISQEIEKIAQAKIEDFKAEKNVLIGTNKYINEKEENLAYQITEKTVEANFAALKVKHLSSFL